MVFVSSFSVFTYYSLISKPIEVYGDALYQSINNLIIANDADAPCAGQAFSCSVSSPTHSVGIGYTGEYSSGDYNYLDGESSWTLYSKASIEMDNDIGYTLDYAVHCIAIVENTCGELAKTQCYQEY